MTQTKAWVLCCTKCGWQQMYKHQNPSWDDWRDCKFCHTRNSVRKRNETVRE